MKSPTLKELKAVCFDLNDVFPNSNGGGAYKKDPLRSIEYLLHELGHSVDLSINLESASTHDNNVAIETLSPAEKDFNEANAIALSIKAAKLLNVPLNLYRIAKFAKANNQYNWSLKAWVTFVRDRCTQTMGHEEFIVNFMKREVYKLRKEGLTP